MTYMVPPDVAAIIEAHVKSGRYASEEEVLRDALHALGDAQDDDDWAAIEEALAERDAGAQGVSVEEAFRIVRERNG